MTALLQPDDLRTLTGSADRGRQAAWLDCAGIPYRWGEAGRRKWLIVAQYHVHEWLAGKAITPSRRPNLAAAT